MTASQLLVNFIVIRTEFFTSDVTKYKGECVDTQQCAWLLGEYSCSSGVCVCSDGWRLYQGKCIAKKGLNEECTKDLDCYNGYDMLAMTCTNGTCACSENYYLRGDYDCRPRASGMYDIRPAKEIPHNLSMSS